ncbi:hypothetical protein ADK86_21415 [Streptomyces sp. NRRL F-5755]|uniref:hypothetical protein n=1 Tax=Streptomyces sp. NRRL F-5755 TaxID=1519475 RepID=UPI0006AE5780|nr:hypothetical protein [Streptomyces sp. NRRL F-5755]KOT92110.1 hypothetical protein ADK86_21415 [Streptomyces sp. NRRL F-5755]
MENHPKHTDSAADELVKEFEDAELDVTEEPDEDERVGKEGDTFSTNLEEQQNAAGHPGGEPADEGR